MDHLKIQTQNHQMLAQVLVLYFSHLRTSQSFHYTVFSAFYLIVYCNTSLTTTLEVCMLLQCLCDVIQLVKCEQQKY